MNDTAPDPGAPAREIGRTVRALLGAESGPDRVRGAVLTPDGYDPALWRRLAGELGAVGLTVPEDHGGLGRPLPELAAVCEETGRALAPSPLLATAGLAVPLVDALGTPGQRAGLLPRAARGELIATLAVPGPGLPVALGLTRDNAPGDWAGGGRTGGVQARRAPDGGWLLYGEATRVLDGHTAGLLLVAARTGGYPRGRTALFLVRGDAPGLTRTRLTALDETRPQARTEFRDTPADLLGDGSGDDTGVTAALAAVGTRLAALLAAEATGTAASALERTVEYVRRREQFGRPIGSFQAVRHRLADLHVRVRAARSAAYYAAREPDGAALALAECLEAARTVTAEAVQLHGGIGFTWEHEAQLYFKRAAGDDILFGPVHLLRAHAADRAGLFAVEPVEPVGSVEPVAPAVSLTPAVPVTPAVPEAAAYGEALR
ncbi:acyl-CoA dehydrogenase family protein [Streptomyces sp. NPDC000594]|uniref:acyl-CoA dehydrogenase family protein n=1 Tax=Streptomyces sp. NPDC000594 TaxID=3154261 RepID=UPI0033228FD8